MVKRVFELMLREISGLHEAAYLLGACAIASQLLAIFRDRLFASAFGASRILDIYYAAFRIPDFIFISIASVVSISVLVPFLIDKLKSGEDTGKHFVNDIFSIFFTAIAVISFLAFLFMPVLIPYLFPGFADDLARAELITMARIMLLSPVFLGISNFLASITQIYNRFLVYALSPLLYNIGIIIGIVVLYPQFGLKGLAYGVVLGAFFHLAIQVPFIRKSGFLPSFQLPFHWSSVKKVVLISLPRTLTLASNQIATFFLVAIASLLGAGSIAVFNLSWNLQSVPLSIVGASYASAAFPALSRFISSGSRDKFLDGMVMSARHIIFWSLPFVALFVVLRAQIVRTILGAGQFDWSDTRLTAACLAIFILSALPQSLLLLFVRGYYALGKTTKPLLINIASSIAIVILGYLFLHLFKIAPTFRYFIESLFKVENVSGSVVLVLPLAYTLGTIINALWHFIAFQREFKDFSRPVWRTFFSSGSAAVIMGYVAYTFLNVFDKVFNINTLVGIFFQGFFSGIIGIAFGILILMLMKNDEIGEIWKVLHHKIWKAKVIGADPVETTH